MGARFEKQALSCCVKGCISKQDLLGKISTCLERKLALASHHSSLNTSCADPSVTMSAFLSASLC